MARKVIGVCACPECGSEAEVKLTKAGLAYRWCPECHAQYFPRSAESSDRLIATCQGTVTAPAPAAAPAPVPEPKPATPPAPAPETAPIKRIHRHGLSDALAVLGVR